MKKSLISLAIAVQSVQYKCIEPLTSNNYKKINKRFDIKEKRNYGK